MPRLLLIAAICVAASGCDLSGTEDTLEPLPIGLNFEMTGSLPEVGAQARAAAELFAIDFNEAGGITIDGVSYGIALIPADNEANADVAVSVTSELINQARILAMVGPNPSNAAVPAGAVANDLETLMISPWSTNPNTTLNRPWVFRVPFLDTFQGPVLANFASSHYSATRACVLYAHDNDYPRGIAASFKDAWESLHGPTSVVAYEIFTTGSEDFTTQLTRIRDADCDVLFTPQYAHEVPLIVTQAQALAITAPILGSDSWGGQTLLDECGDACEGYFFSAHYVAAGATGATKAFIDKYEAAFGETPGDVAALTWDAMRLVAEALENCGELTGNLITDRACIRDGMASIQNFDGITGTMTYNDQGDPIKCAVMVQIVDGEFTAVESACP